MKKVCASAYIKLGTALRYLIDRSEGEDIKKEDRIFDNINIVINLFETLKFKTVVNSPSFPKLRKIHKEFNDLPSDSTLTKEQAERLENICRKLRETMYGQAQEIFCFHPVASLVSSDSLIEKIEDIIGEDVFFKLPKKSRNDLREAGKCLAFGVSTAAAFHLMRSVEETMKTFFKVVVPNTPLPGKGMMGEIENYFRYGSNYKSKSRKIPNYFQQLKLSEEFVNDLGIIRREYRNPTQHPEKFYSQQEAEDLLYRVRSILRFMTSDSRWINSSSSS